ncbi:MAG TPA: vWA domain-containing protein [Polyangiaceae bacterium]|nr:vWA domain-containing protein [Polyangiaceae bacterium]
MTKYLSILPIGLLAFACGSNTDSGTPSFGDSSGGSAPIDIGSGGKSSTIDLSSGGSTANAGSGNTSGTGNISNPTNLDELEKASCAGWDGEAEQLPSILQFVVDTSGSMDSETDSTNGQTKWERTRTALLSSIDKLPATVGLGMLFYPNMETIQSSQPSDVNECVRLNALIPIDLLGAAGSAQRNRLATGIKGIRPTSFTPTYDAYTSGVDKGLLPSKLPGKRFMVLITDGAPTLSGSCVMPAGSSGNHAVPVDPDPIVEAIKVAHDAKIQTFVIGSPGSEESIDGEDARVAWLSKAARAGGTDKPGCSDSGPNFCHIDLTQSADFGAALADSLAKIAGAAVQCSYELPSPGAGKTLDLNAINVVLTGSNGSKTLIARSEDPNCSEGWKLNGNLVELCSNTCTQAKADTGASLKLMFGCASVTVVK